jgi:hypothetical protein
MFTTEMKSETSPHPMSTTMRNSSHSKSNSKISPAMKESPLKSFLVFLSLVAGLLASSLATTYLPIPTCLQATTTVLSTS